MEESSELMAADCASPTALRDSRPWLIGGPARCGKSSLALAVAATGHGPAVLPVDALFPVYLRRRYPFFQRNKAKILRDYLLQPRYTDPSRSRTTRPIDGFKTPIEEVVIDALSSPAEHPITLFAASLDRLARERGRDTWLAVDLHSELHYAALRGMVPGLRLAIMLRDPREAIAASLYWRSFPERVDQGNRQFRYHLFLWLLSAQTGFALRTAMPGSVTILNFHALLDGGDERANAAFGLDAGSFAGAFDGLPLYSYEPGRGFLCPDKTWRPLLSSNEIALIDAAAARWMNKLGFAPATASSRHAVPGGYGLLLWILLSIGRVDAAAAKSLFELLFMPRAWVARRVTQAKQLLKDLLQAARQ